MISNRPETLAMRTVNQYRRRDILAYLSVRYYVENLAARTDHWARHAAVDLVLTNTTASYFKTYHFKEIDESNEIKYREIFLPSANEALAEAALLNECSKFPEFSKNPSCVFSYALSDKSDYSGTFSPYIIGLRLRQAAIANACKMFPSGIVRHTDIKKFYPTINLALASRKWNERCEHSKIDKRFKALGLKILENYGKVPDNTEKTLLIGPAFSHFIANMILKDLDVKFNLELPVKYLRYVDDITLIGDQNSVDASIDIIKDELQKLGLALHEDNSIKNMQGKTSEWLKYRSDFHENRQKISWKTLIGDLRRFLLLHPEMKDQLVEAFLKEGYNIPIYDYIVTTKDRTYVERFYTYFKNLRFRNHSKKITIESLLVKCRFLNSHYHEEISDLLVSLNDKHDFDRKSKIPKIRYRAGRLIYLASNKELLDLCEKLKTIPEMFFHTAIMESIYTKNIDNILLLGTNCAQAAAQPLKASKSSVFMTLKNLSPAQEQSLTIFKLHGIKIDGEITGNSNFLRFATFGADEYLMKSEDSFIREVACLHGINENPRHSEMLNSIFDEEDFALDAIDQLTESLSP